MEERELLVLAIGVQSWHTSSYEITISDEL